MSLENPTPLQIGMRGTFAGRNFQLLGRVVMGMEVNGETYYWNEFNLQAETGEKATLVFEDSDGGGEWRLFTMFEPEYPQTAADAVTKQVGDRLNLTGTDVSVTLVSTSRVYRIEGLPPEGVQVGSEANYFNAEAGDVMQVVSWTGQDVEYYNGLNLGRRAVEAAFNLPHQTGPSGFSRLDDNSLGDDSGNGNYLSAKKFLVWIGVAALFFLFIAGRGCSSTYEAAPVKHISAPPAALTVGTVGHWGGQSFHITAHAVVQIAEMEAIYERNEYELTGDLGQMELLVCGSGPGTNDWTLFTPLTPLTPPTAGECAGKKMGETVDIDGVEGKVSELFQDTVRHLDNTAPSGWHEGDVQYGYVAQSGSNLLLVRWNNNGVSFYSGKGIAARDVQDFIAAFGSSK